MRPTLQPGDFLIGRAGARPARFDVVAFQHPARPGFWMVKRVLGLEGETIDLDRQTIDGRRYVDPFHDGLLDSGSWEVPTGSMFVVSDDRAATRADSRTLGPVPIAGSYRIRFRYWPLHAFGRIRAPRTPAG